MHKWLSEGKIDVKETTTEGIENWPHAFISLFEGKNVGKVVIKI
jgi:NADPH-dependent curcumin reductase CurA